MKIDGKYLRKLRQGRGLSLRALADKIYVSKSTLQRWELSHVPEEDEEICARLAEALGVGVEELVVETEDGCEVLKKYAKDLIVVE